MRYSLTVRETARLSAMTSPSGQQYPPSSRTEISKRPQEYSVRERLQPLYVIKHSPTYSRNIRLLDSPVPPPPSVQPIQLTESKLTDIIRTFPAGSSAG